MRLLDEQSGSTKSVRSFRGDQSDIRGNNYNAKDGKRLENSSTERGYDDSGGASRFFYCAKVSTSERESGMIGNFPCRTCGKIESETHLNEKNELVRCSRNTHPTLKPIDLCRYLAALLLAPPRADDLRQIIIPFSGAGSEIAGALSAGWDMVIGIEMDREYINWAESRIPALVSERPKEPRKVISKTEPDIDMELFS